MENHKKVCRVFNDFEYCLIFISAVSDCVLIFAFTSLTDVSVDTANSAVGIKNCVITSGKDNHEETGRSSMRKYCSYEKLCYILL